MSSNPIDVLTSTLRAFDDIDLLKRLDVRRVIDVFANDSVGGSRGHTIYHDKIEYIGLSTQLIVFRPKGKKHEAREQTEYAFFDDTVGIYQPISAAQIIQFFARPPRGLKLQTDLNRLVARAAEAQERIKVLPKNRS